MARLPFRRLDLVLSGLFATVWGVASAGVLAGGLPTYSPPPSAASLAWRGWYEQLLETRISEVEFDRDETRYVSSSVGEDLNDGETPRTAWASIDRAREWLASPGSGTREVLFRRGDAWYATSGIATSRPGTRFADYGDAELERPYVSGFAARFPPGDGGWTQEPAPHEKVYSRPLETMVYWVRQDGDADLETPLCRELSVAGVQTTAGSWWFDEERGILSVQPRLGDDADAHLFEACTAEGSAFQIAGDRTLIENIRADGWGMNELQVDPFQSQVVGTDQAVIRNCVAYYGFSHLMSHYLGNAQGGVATLIDCTAGFTKYNGLAGETVFNTYASGGGQETIFHDCTVARGTLPAAEQRPTARRGIAAFGHTNGATQEGLVVVSGMRVIDHPFGCASPPSFANLPPAETLFDVRCFIVDTVLEGGLGSGGFGAPLVRKGTALINCRYAVQPPPVFYHALQPTPVDGWFINGTVDLDLSQQIDSLFALYNTTTLLNHARIWNSAIYVHNVPAGMEVRIDHDGPNSSPQASMYNTIFAKVSGEGTLNANLPPSRENLSNNAYWQAPVPAGESSPVTLLELPPPDMPPAPGSPLIGAAAPLPEGVVLEFDQLGRPRTSSTVGPLEGGPDGDVNTDGVVDIGDLLEIILAWGACPEPPALCPADLDRNGLVDVSDLVAVLSAWG